MPINTLKQSKKGTLIPIQICCSAGTCLELNELAANGEIRELQLLSLQGGFYLARAQLEHGQVTLLDDVAKPMRLRSITHLRELLQLAPSFPCVLVQQSVHDEMCGSREGSIAALRIPFSLTAPW